MELPAWRIPDALGELDRAGDRGVLRELIADFRQDTEARLDRMDAALQRHDAAALKSEAHSLRGSAGQMGAVGFAALCLEIEGSAAEMNWPTQEEFMARARAMFAAVVRAMSAA